MLTAGLVLTSCEKKSNEVVTDKNDETVLEDNNTEAMAMDDSQVNKDWSGTYEGTLPCASCEGIKTVIVLNQDGTYTQEEEYLSPEGDKYSDAGTFVWNEAGDVITLTSNKDASQKPMYKVEDGRIIALTDEGKAVEGALADAYVLNKK